jgi:hypothetical protein
MVRIVTTVLRFSNIAVVVIKSLSRESNETILYHI